MTPFFEKLFINILLAIIKDWLIVQLYLNFNKNAKITRKQANVIMHCEKLLVNTSEEQHMKINFTVPYRVSSGLRLQGYRWFQLEQDYCGAKWVKLVAWLPLPLLITLSITCKMILIVWPSWTDEDQLLNKNDLLLHSNYNSQVNGFLIPNMDMRGSLKKFIWLNELLS